MTNTLIYNIKTLNIYLFIEHLFIQNSIKIRNLKLEINKSAHSSVVRAPAL